jgi:hypothetical protein
VHCFDVEFSIAEHRDPEEFPGPTFLTNKFAIFFLQSGSNSSLIAVHTTYKHIFS